MFRTVLAALSVAALLCAPQAGAQSFSGTYVTTSRDGGQVTVTLVQDAAGRVTGTLAGPGAQFTIEGAIQGGDVVGLARSADGPVYLEGALEGDGIRIILADLGPDGSPRADAAREVFFQRQGTAAAAAPRPNGNPLSGARSAGTDDAYAGTFASQMLLLTLAARGGGEYAGTLVSEGSQYPVTARLNDGRLVGSVTAQGVGYAFEARVQGSAMTVVSDGVTYELQRQDAPATVGAQTGGGTGGPASSQDQYVTQLLLGSRWCHFSYSAAPGYTGSGREYRETVQFRSDGTLQVSTGGESYSSGQYGSVAGQGSGGQTLAWRVQNGMLYLSPDGQQWQPLSLQVTQNANGYPIVTADGKEYAQCN